MKEISQETIQKISETKSEASREKIIKGINDNIIPKQSEVQLAVPTHRTRAWLTFEEYKKLIKEGLIVQDLKNKYSKHLVAFYTYLAKGNVKLTKEQFEEEYNNGVSLNEIAEKYSIPREHITYLREYYGIKRKGAKYIKRLKEEQPFPEDAKDIIIGSMLGDGHITKWGYFSEKHSPAQLEYLKWKASFLRFLTTDTSWDYREDIDKRSGSLIKSHSFRTTTHSFFYEIRNKFYKEIDGEWEKVIPEDIESTINARVLAIWYMDDGRTSWPHRHGVKEFDGSRASASICTDSFSVKEVETLISIIKTKFSIDCSLLLYSDNNRPRISFNADNTEKLFSAITPFIHPSIKYKIHEDDYIVYYNNKNKENNEDDDQLLI